MNKRLGKITAGLLALGLMLAPVVQAQSSYYFWWQVIDQRGRPYPSQAIRCSVYDYPASHSANSGVGSGSAKLLHFDADLGAGRAGFGSTAGTTMPLLSDASSKLHFYSSSSADVMVTCFYDRGGAATNVVISRNVHQVMIDREGRKVVRFPFSSGQAAARTGVWFGPGDVIRDVLVNVTSGPYGTAQSNTPVGSSPGTPHLNVGFAGAHTYQTLGLANAPILTITGSPGAACAGCSPMTSVLIHTMGLTSDSVDGTAITVRDWIRPHVQVTSAGNYAHISASHRGVALAFWRPTQITAAPGAAPLSAGAHVGAYMEVAYAVPTNLEVTFSTSTTPGLSGHVYIFFDSMHAGSGFGGPSNSGLYPNNP